MITPFERFSFIDNSGQQTPSNRLATYIEETTRQVNLSTIITGSGSPEGAVTARVTALYMDTAGTAGNILYIKKTGAGNTGWILV